MREAGVNLVSVGIFSWALLEPARGRVRLRLAGPGRWTCCTAPASRSTWRTPTAAPPAWFSRRPPAARSVDRDGHPRSARRPRQRLPQLPRVPRGRGRHRRASSPRATASHPAVVHVARAQRVRRPRSATATATPSAAAFRGWLRRRLRRPRRAQRAPGAPRSGASATATGTRSTRPGCAPTVGQPGPAAGLHALLRRRSCCACFRAERDILRRLPRPRRSPPTSWPANCKSIDYWKWAREVDVVSNDHYLRGRAPDNHIDLAMAADLTRSLAGGAPWLLMEHSTSAVNWQPRNIAKRPGEMPRNSLAHVARGADGDAVLPVAGLALRRGEVPLGDAAARRHRHPGLARGRRARRRPRRLAACGAPRVAADVAVVWDWESWWALELEWRPSVDLTFRERVDAFYDALWRDAPDRRLRPPRRRT